MGRKKKISGPKTSSQMTHPPDNHGSGNIGSVTISSGDSPRDLPAASIWRLLAAWLYDGMLLFSILMLASAIYILPQQLMIPVDASNPENLSTTRFSGPLFYSILFIVSYFFLAWFWTHGGQTIGLRAWSLRLQTQEGLSLSWSQALQRFLAAATPWVLALFLYAQTEKAGVVTAPGKYFILLIGFSGILWALFDKQGRTFQDIFSASRIVRITKKKKKQ